MNSTRHCSWNTGRAEFGLIFMPMGQVGSGSGFNLTWIGSGWNFQAHWELCLSLAPTCRWFPHQPLWPAVCLTCCTSLVSLHIYSWHFACWLLSECPALSALLASLPPHPVFLHICFYCLLCYNFCWNPQSQTWVLILVPSSKTVHKIKKSCQNQSK